MQNLCGRTTVMKEENPDTSIDMKPVKEELMGRFTTEGFGIQKREVSVMVRLSASTVEILDALVELEIFKSKSEAVAAFVDQTIASREELFEEIRSQAQEIISRRESAKHLAYKAVMAKRK